MLHILRQRRTAPRSAAGRVCIEWRTRTHAHCAALRAGVEPNPDPKAGCRRGGAGCRPRVQAVRTYVLTYAHPESTHQAKRHQKCWAGGRISVQAHAHARLKPQATQRLSAGGETDAPAGGGAGCGGRGRGAHERVRLPAVRPTGLPGFKRAASVPGGCTRWRGSAPGGKLPVRWPRPAWQRSSMPLEASGGLVIEARRPWVDQDHLQK